MSIGTKQKKTCNQSVAKKGRPPLDLASMEGLSNLVTIARIFNAYATKELAHAQRPGREGRERERESDEDQPATEHGQEERAARWRGRTMQGWRRTKFEGKFREGDN